MIFLSAVFSFFQDVNWHDPIVYLAASVLGTLSLTFIFTRIINRRFRRQKDKEIESLVRQFIDERTKSEIILSDLDIGVIAYNSEELKINDNPAARKMLEPNLLPATLTEFIDSYGQENGIRAARLLGNHSISGLVHNQDRILRIHLKESRFDNNSAGALIIIQDITEQEREEKQRKKFVANVSHELKTPLTTIKSYSESLLEWGLAEKDIQAIRKDIWRIFDDSLRMEQLVEDLLLLSSIDSQGIRIQPEIMDLPRVIRQVCDRLQVQAAENDIELGSVVLTTIPLVLFDRSALERIVTNLVANAIKYTDQDGSVQVYVSYLLNNVYIKVADNGYGIGAEHIDRIFDRFYRVNMTGSRMYGGTGLGLSIAQELVELHHGEITVASTLGKGTEFTIMIPIARKVLKGVTRDRLTGGIKKDALYFAVIEELKKAARELGLPEKALNRMGGSEIEQLTNKILELDPTNAALDEDTKRVPTVDPDQTFSVESVAGGTNK